MMCQMQESEYFYLVSGAEVHCWKCRDLGTETLCKWRVVVFTVAGDRELPVSDLFMVD